MRIDYFK